MFDSKYKNLTFKIVTVIFSFIFSFYLVEVFLSVFYVFPIPVANYYPFSPAQKGGIIAIDQYEFSTTHNYNLEGFRQEELNFKKDQQRKRILFIGDSFVEGYGVEVDQRFSSLFASKVQNKLDVINIGQLATNPDTYLDNLITFGIALKPDLVVMTLFIGNDFMGGRDYKILTDYKVDLSIKEESNKNTRYIKQIITFRYTRELANEAFVKDYKPEMQKRFVKGNFWDLYFNKKISKSFYIEASKVSEDELDKVVSTFNQTLVKNYYDGKIIPTLLLEGIKNKVKHSDDEEYSYTEEDYINTLKIIKEINKVLKENDIKLIVIVLPDINQVYPEKFKTMLKKDFDMDVLPSRLLQLGDIKTRIIKDMTKKDISTLDVTGALRKADNMTYHLYDQHMNEYGHKVVSDELIKFMQTKYTSYFSVKF